MKKINTTLLILGLLGTAINWSCEKSIVPEEKNESIDEQKKLRLSDMLSNQIVIDWSLIAFEAVGGAAEPHALLAFTETVPPVDPAVVVMDVDVELPDQPEGNVHVYEVAPLTATIEYV